MPTDVWLSSYALDPTLPLTGRREPPACWPSGAGQRPREPDSGCRMAGASSGDERVEVSPALATGHRNAGPGRRTDASSTTPMNSSAAARWSCPPPTIEPSTRQVQHRDGHPEALFLYPGGGDQQLALQLDRSTLVAVTVSDQGAKRRTGLRPFAHSPGDLVGRR